MKRVLQRLDQFEGVGAARGDKVIERGIHAVVLELFRLARVEYRESRIDSRGDGIFP